MTSFERTHMRCAASWLACRLAVMGGTPVSPLHRQVRSMDTLAWALLGQHDWGWEMRLLCKEAKNSWRGELSE